MSETTPVEAQLIDIEPLTFALPKAKVDTRPVWPGQIEVIYSKYIAKKVAFLATNPIVQETNYRKSRGLKV